MMRIHFKPLQPAFFEKASSAQIQYKVLWRLCILIYTLKHSCPNLDCREIYIIANIETQQSLYAAVWFFYRLPYVHNKICPTQNLVLQHTPMTSIIL